MNSVTSSIITNFIWSGKTPRICKPLLQRERSKGGLGLPNFQSYYWAANMHKIALWLSDTEESWVQLESNSCHSSSLKALVCSSLPLKPKQHSSNPLVTSTLKIWQQIRQHFDWTSCSLATPLCNNQQFQPGKIDGRFSTWSTQGLSCLGDFYIDGTFASFTQLRTTFNLQNSDLFRYFQFRNFARLNTLAFPQIPAASGIDHILPVTQLPKGHISFLYNLLLTATPPALLNIKVRWETELGTTLSDRFWDAALKNINSSSSCARLCLIQFKVLHRMHYSKAKLSRIYPDLTDICDRCSQAPADLTHMFWSCPRLVEYWQSFFNVISEILGVKLDPSPSIAIFGIPEEGTRLNTRQKNIVSFASLIARRRILLLWKNQLPPSNISWLQDLMSFLKLEKIKFAVRGSTEQFYKHWQPLISYFNNTLQNISSAL